MTPFIWPCYKKTGSRGYNPSTPHYGIDRDSYYQCSDQRNAPGDPIYPICAETVVKVYEKHADFGNSVWINSSNPNTTAITTGAYIRHLYMHFNSKPLVSVGDPVTTRNVPLLLSHVCLCAVRFDGYLQRRSLKQPTVSSLEKRAQKSQPP